MPNGAKTSWTDELIERQLREITGAIGSFPTASELRSMGKNDLTCAATKSGGLIAWAARLGLSRKDSDSDFGWRGEIAMCEHFRQQGFSAERTKGVKAPFDIMVNDLLRVDVKTASRAEYSGHSRGWYFRTGKIPQADVVVLYRMDRNDFFGVPWWECTSSNMSICDGLGRFGEFHNNWWLIRQMISRRQDERELMKQMVVVA